MAPFAGGLRRHPILLSVGILILAIAVAFLLLPWGFVSDVRARDMRFRRAVAPIADRFDPMYAPPQVSGWSLRVTWFCMQLGLAEDPYIPVCADLAPHVERRRTLDFSFRSEEPPRLVCSVLKTLMDSTGPGCVGGGMRFGARFYQLDGTLPEGVVADVQVRRALVAPGRGIVDPEHPHPPASITTVVSVNVKGGQVRSRSPSRPRETPAPAP